MSDDCLAPRHARLHRAEEVENVYRAAGTFSKIVEVDGRDLHPALSSAVPSCRDGHARQMAETVVGNGRGDDVDVRDRKLTAIGDQNGRHSSADDGPIAAKSRRCGS